MVFQLKGRICQPSIWMGPHNTDCNGPDQTTLCNGVKKCVLVLQSARQQRKKIETAAMAGGGKRRSNHNHKTRNKKFDNRNIRKDSGASSRSRRRSKELRNSLFVEGGVLADWSPIHSGPLILSLYSFFSLFWSIFVGKDRNFQVQLNLILNWIRGLSLSLSIFFGV